MNYIIYADVMLLWNFIINVSVLIISSKLLRINFNIIKTVLWSLATGIITEMIYILFLGNILLPLFYALIYFFMTCVYFKTNSLKDMLQKNMAVLCAMLIIYGIITVFKGGEQSSLAHILISLMIGILLFCLAVKNVSRNLSGKYHRLIFVCMGQRIKITGYQDTGNTLINPYNQSPVMIIDYRILKKIFNDEAYYNILKYQSTGYFDFKSFNEITGLSVYPVAYSTINSKYEIMPVFTIKNLLFIDEKLNLKNVSVGISRYKFKNDFHMLLNENIKI